MSASDDETTATEKAAGDVLTKAFAELKAVEQDGLEAAEAMIFRGLVEMENHACRAHFIDCLTELRDTIDGRLDKMAQEVN